MTKKLEELFNLPELINEEETLEQMDPQKALAESAEIINAITNSEKLDLALTTVKGLHEHDDDMDELAELALRSYKDLMALGMNVSDAHAGRIFEVSNLMLETRFKCKDAKVNRKLKILDLQLKKARLDHDMKVAASKTGEDDGETGKGNTFDRNELLRIITQDSEKK